VLDFLASFPTSTHFELLGVPRSASLDEVRQAYARQAAFYHPDQHRKPGLAEVHPHLKSISARLDEAHQVLTDPRRRAQDEEFLGPARQADAPPLVAPPATGSFAPQPFVAAGGPRLPSSKEVLAHARALIARDKYWDAIQELEAAVPRAEGRPERCALQVLLAATMMKNPKWLHQCEELLTNVTSENPKHVEAHLLLAGLYKGRGLRTRAERLYRKVLELDPENAAAAQELSALTEPPAGSAT
jgi:tetratricopeptide (TPR) repeat protein